MESTSTEARKQLPLCLIESEILPRLSVKSVGRCMCVCKQWKSFLSTPKFAKTHLNNHVTINDYKVLVLLDGQPPRTLPLITDGSTTIPYNPNHPNPNPHSIFILASLDGLVCLASRKLPTQLMLWNPLTRAYKKLSSNPSFRFSARIYFDPVGFYIDSSNDYKLVYLIEGGKFGAYIYSLKSDSWREIEFKFGSNTPCIWSSATLCGRSLYFIATPLALFGKHRWIICFDVNTETFRKIQFPGGGGRYCGSLAVINGCVHLCVSCARLNMKRGDLWRMDGDDGWVKVAAFSEPLDNEFGRHRICTASNGNWLAVLDQENNCFKKVSAEDFIRQYGHFCCPGWEYRSSRTIYAETLVSPNP